VEDLPSSLHSHGDATRNYHYAVLLVPVGLVAVTVWAPSAAVLPVAIANVAVIVVGFTMVTALTVMPPAGATATVVPVVVKLVPVRVTAVVVKFANSTVGQILLVSVLCR
jgi:hypothetical protein